MIAQSALIPSAQLGRSIEAGQEQTEVVPRTRPHVQHNVISGDGQVFPGGLVDDRAEVFGLKLFEVYGSLLIVLVKRIATEHIEHWLFALAASEQLESSGEKGLVHLGNLDVSLEALCHPQHEEARCFNDVSGAPKSNIVEFFLHGSTLAKRVQLHLHRMVVHFILLLLGLRFLVVWV